MNTEIFQFFCLLIRAGVLFKPFLKVNLYNCNNLRENCIEVMDLSQEQAGSFGAIYEREAIQTTKFYVDFSVTHSDEILMVICLTQEGITKFVSTLILEWIFFPHPI